MRLILAGIMSTLLRGCASFNVGEPEVFAVDRGAYGRVVVTRQKRMSFGFFPALAESLFRPPDSIKPLVGWQHRGSGSYVRSSDEPALRYVCMGPLMTPWSLLVTPWHGEYSCDTHHWTRNKVELIRLLPIADQQQLHIKTWMDGKDWQPSSVTHASLFGFHRYATVVVEEKDPDED